MSSGPTCAQRLNDDTPCGLPVHPVHARFLLVPAAQARADRCLLHRDDNRISRVLAVLAERRHPVLAGVDALCPYWECCGTGQPVRVPGLRPGCVLELEESAGLVLRYLDALDVLGVQPSPFTDQLVADLVVRRLLLSRVESHLVSQGIIEEIHVESDKGCRTTTGRASSLLRTVAQLAQSIRQDEQRLLPLHSSSARPSRPDDRWLVVTDDNTQDDDADA